MPRTKAVLPVEILPVEKVDGPPVDQELLASQLVNPPRFLPTGRVLLDLREEATVPYETIERVLKNQLSLPVEKRNLTEVTKYAIALQRMIEYFCADVPVPAAIAKECPRHFQMLTLFKEKRVPHAVVASTTPTKS